jgi:Protein of unknown function (DUF3500)
MTTQPELTAMRLVASGLSTAGYVTVALTMGLENVLDHAEGFTASFGRGRDPGMYYLRVTANRATVSEGDRAIPLTGIWRGPRFLDPAEQERIQAASDAIDAAAGFSESDHRAVEFTASPKGLPAAELDDRQRALLRALLGTYFGRVPDGVSPLGRYHGTALDAVHVAWAGPLEPGRPHYYRIQGPDLLIEWDNTQRGANHAHSVWRDPSRDFGLDVLALLHHHHRRRHRRHRRHHHCRHH